MYELRGKDHHFDNAWSNPKYMQNTYVRSKQL